VDVKPDVIVVDATVVVVSTVSELLPQEEASKSKQTTAPNFLIPTSLAYPCGGATRRILLRIDTNICSIKIHGV